jgi:hypothetical protein
LVRWSLHPANRPDRLSDCGNQAVAAKHPCIWPPRRSTSWPRLHPLRSRLA